MNARPDASAYPFGFHSKQPIPVMLPPLGLTRGVFQIQPAPDSVAAGEGIPLSTLALNCDILVAAHGDRIPAGTLVIPGYGIAGDGHSIERIDVSIDDGHT